MSKKIIFTILFVLIIGGVCGYYFWNKQKEENQVSRISNIVAPSPTPVLVEWDDPAYFTFRYPKEITIDPHPENKNDYAQVELKSTQDHPGGITIWAKDSSAAEIDDYLKQQKITNALDTTLGGIPAKKYSKAEETVTLSIGAIQYGHLYLIEANFVDDAYWTDILDKIVSSFQFKDLPEAEENSSSGSDTPEVIDSGDEVIE